MPSQISDQRVTDILTAYAHHPSVAVPTRQQWQNLVSLPQEVPVALINYFRFREHAVYPDNRETNLSGQEAFGLYTAVSGDALSRAGGSFVLFGTPRDTLIGDDQHWDLMVIGRYESAAGVAAIFEDPDYQKCFIHRTAAMADQRVAVCQL